MSSTLIISVSGLRGITGSGLTSQVIDDYTAAYAAWLDASLDDGAERAAVLVSRDGRAGGAEIAKQVADGLSRAGFDVLLGGVVATPTVGVLIRHLQLSGAIQITASHNPAEYNGMKLYTSRGRILNQQQGEQVLRGYELKNCVVGVKCGSTSELDDTSSEHIRLLMASVDADSIRSKGIKVLLDCNHGAGSPLGRQLLSDLGCDVTVLGAEPNGAFAHGAEPTRENLLHVGRNVIDGGFDIGFCQDPDADRLAVLDEQGNYIGEELTMALCLKSALPSLSGPVVVNCATSGINRLIAEQFGVACYESAVGEANVVEQMDAVNAVFGGEGNGGPIDPSVGYIRDSFVGMVRILDLMTREAASVSQIVSKLPVLAIEKTKIPVEPSRVALLLDLLSARFSDEEQSRQDGLKITWPNGEWLLVRGSNTEPIVRAIAEGPSSERSLELCGIAAQCAAQLD